jgi:hypothetical protein
VAYFDVDLVIDFNKWIHVGVADFAESIKKFAFMTASVAESFHNITKNVKFIN